MEQTALRPKPMPGRKPDGVRPAARRPHAARRRGRRLITTLFSLLVGTVLVLAGVGIGTVGATVIGTGTLTGPQRRTDRPGAAPGAPSAPARPGVLPAAAAPAPATASLGVEVMDTGKPGALVVGVHVPGPGYAAGLVRGDVILALGRARVDSAADLVRALARARSGAGVTLTVRHRSGGYQQLPAVPGVVT